MFIRNNRRSKLVSALLGAVIVVIPTSVIILYIVYNMNIYKHKLNEYGMGESMTASVYMAKSDMVKGEKNGYVAGHKSGEYYYEVNGT